MISKKVKKKKRIMEQFSLEKYLANPSRRIVTRDGRNARIICTDKKGFEYPIVALIENKLEGFEGVLYYTKDGEYTANKSSDKDLFFAPEKHEGWINIYINEDEDYYKGMVIFSSKEDAIEKGRKFSDYITTTKIEWEG